MIRVVVVDDHPLLRQGIVRILSDTADIVVVGEAASAAAAVDLVTRHAVDLLVLDLSMPGRGGFEVLGQLASWPHAPRTLVLSVHPEDQFAVRALRAGAHGYLNKEAAPEELVKAIRRIHAGGRYITPAVAEQIADAIDPRHDGPVHERLSPREFQVFRLLAQGHRVPEIAPMLALSPSTVHTIRRRMLVKLGVKRDVEVARYAVQHGLVD